MNGGDLRKARMSPFLRAGGNLAPLSTARTAPPCVRGRRPTGRRGCLVKIILSVAYVTAPLVPRGNFFLVRGGGAGGEK